MSKNLLYYIKSAIVLCYFALVVITPLLFTTYTTELFEVPKMYFVYFFAILILILTKTRFILEKKKSIPVDLVTISFVIFLLAQIASTLISIDKFTSIFGYPSRLNGGLISQFAYFTIFVAALINLKVEDVKKITLATVVSATFVAIWGIPSHFGFDPNCLILKSSLTSSCWQLEFDPTKRIFSTLGQPNWLASYLVLILPVAISLVLTTKILQKRIIFASAAFVIFLALIFTNSRAGFVGSVASILTLAFLLGVKRLEKNAKILLILLVPLVLIGVLFGSTLAARLTELVSPTDAPGTPSEKIRLIVWRGAVEVFKKSPFLGTGPETFAYSYYKVRPLAHNDVTEWNFFYNKAHNEFLNYLANVGALGLLTYLLFLASALYLIWQEGRKSKEAGVQILLSGVAASIIGYQVTIFFGFSIVTTQLLMFIFIAFALILANKNKLLEINLKFVNSKFQILFIIVAALIGLYLVNTTTRLLIADILINSAKESDAISINPTENPFYLANASLALAQHASSSENEDSVKFAIKESKKLADRALAISPNNVIVARRIANAFILLSNVDESFYDDTRGMGYIIINLAPTDPQSYLTFAKIHIATEKKEAAKLAILKALDLKPDYLEAQKLLEQIETKEIQ